LKIGNWKKQGAFDSQIWKKRSGFGFKENRTWVKTGEGSDYLKIGKMTIGGFGKKGVRKNENWRIRKKGG